MTDRTLESVLKLMRTDDVLTAEAKQKLIVAAGTSKVSDLANFDGASLAEFLIAADPNLTDVSDLLAVAGRLIEAFSQASRKTDTATTTATTVDQAIKVQVELPRNIDDMSLKELLSLLADNPDRADEILAYVQAQPQVINAQRKHERLAIVRDGRLDVDATVRYITHLARDYTQSVELFEGIRPTTFAKAAGTDSRPYIHPFTGEPIEGPDELGFDFSTLDEERHNALLWASITKHPAWPAVVDRYSMSLEVFETNLPQRWKLILDAFRAAKADGDELATRINRYYPKDLMSALGLGGNTAGRRLPFGSNPATPEPERNEAWCKEQLIEVAQAAIRTGGSNIRRSNCVLGSTISDGGNIDLQNVIVLANIHTGGGNLSGTIYMAPGTTVYTNGGNNRASVYDCTWQRLYEKAVQLGIITP